MRKEDLERMEQERHAQQRAHEQQLELLKEQMAALAAHKSNESGARGPNTKMFWMCALYSQLPVSNLHAGFSM